MLVVTAQAGEQVAPADQGGAEGGGADAAQARGFHQHPRIARVHGQTQHLPADGREVGIADGMTGGPAFTSFRRGKPAFAWLRRGKLRIADWRWSCLLFDGAEGAEQFFGAGDRLGIGRVEPGEPRRVGNAEGMEQQDDLGQIAALNFGGVALGAVQVAAFRPEPVADAGGGASGPPRPLLGGGAADRFEQEGADAPLRIVAGDAGQSTVNYMDNAVNRDGGFGDVGGDDEFAPAVGGEGQVLLLRRQFAVEGDHGQRLAQPRRAAGGQGGVDLRHAGHENQDVARLATLDDARHRVARLLGNGAFVRQVEVADFHGKRPARGFENGTAAEVTGHGRGFEGGGHDDDFQIGPAALLQPPDQGEGHVAQEIAFVKFIENHDRDVAQAGVVLKPAQQNALGDKTDAGAEAGAVVEADLVADLRAQRAAPLPGHAGGDGAGGDAAGLEDNDAAGAGRARGGTGGIVEEHLGDLGGFAGAGGSDEDEAIVLFDRINDAGMNPPDGKGGLHAAGANGPKAAYQRSTRSTASTTTEKRRSNPEGMNLEVLR